MKNNIIENIKNNATEMAKKKMQKELELTQFKIQKEKKKEEFMKTFNNFKKCLLDYQNLEDKERSKLEYEKLD